MKFERSSGILLHPTSLPSPYGIGDIGPTARRWLDYLNQTGSRLWQLLPLGPTGYGDSPYQCFSAFAGNPYLISPDELVQDGLLSPEDLKDHPDFPDGHVDFGAVIPWKLDLLARAYRNFLAHPDTKLQKELEKFRQAQSLWLDDYALFMSIKEDRGGGSWANWPVELRTRQPEAVEEARTRLTDSIERTIFQQFLFFRQWSKLRKLAKELGISIIGDIPIFVAHDSADVWANLDLFYMDEEGQPTFVAGVPPDYFSPTGQLWGNPLYRWDVHKKTGYRWWIERFKAVLQLVDIVRLDHFRGFAGYWEIPAGNKTAVEGRWAPGPGKDFFYAIKNALGELPIIAEDLGVITPDVVELREAFNLPGMKVFQFAFWTDANDPFLPHNYTQNYIVYTGTHDNDTTLSWFKTAPESERDRCLRYLGTDEKDIVWDVIREVWASVCVFSLAPMQDLLSLGSEARMNFPGKPSGNWTWRVSQEALSNSLCKRVREFNELYGRMNPVT